MYVSVPACQIIYCIITLFFAVEEFWYLKFMQLKVYELVLMRLKQMSDIEVLSNQLILVR
jgi:hypothetical protein